MELRHMLHSASMERRVTCLVGQCLCTTLLGGARGSEIIRGWIPRAGRAEASNILGGFAIPETVKGVLSPDVSEGVPERETVREETGLAAGSEAGGVGRPTVELAERGVVDEDLSAELIESRLGVDR